MLGMPLISALNKGKAEDLRSENVVDRRGLVSKATPKSLL